jgi:hypothetical protein
VLVLHYRHACVASSQILLCWTKLQYRNLHIVTGLLPGAACKTSCAGQCVTTCFPVPAAYNEEFRTTLGDKRLQELLLKIDGAPNREQVGTRLLAGKQLCSTVAGCLTDALHNMGTHSCQCCSRPCATHTASKGMPPSVPPK